MCLWSNWLSVNQWKKYKWRIWISSIYRLGSPRCGVHMYTLTSIKRLTLCLYCLKPVSEEEGFMIDDLNTQLPPPPPPPPPPLGNRPWHSLPFNCTQTNGLRYGIRRNAQRWTLNFTFFRDVCMYTNTISLKALLGLFAFWKQDS